jgi:hypothetical protein
MGRGKGRRGGGIEGGRKEGRKQGKKKVGRKASHPGTLQVLTDLRECLAASNTSFPGPHTFPSLPSER